jgi:manganese transport protein
MENHFEKLIQVTKSSFENLIPRELLRYLGPGFLITVGFIDPGNWATNIEGGSRFNYDLLWVVTLSTLMLMVLQSLSAKLGIVTGRSLAANIYKHFSKPVSGLLGITIFTACIFTDIAELLGGALGFNLLFGFPLWAGAALTVLIVTILVIGQKYHSLERIIIGFLGVIALCYIVELFIVKPDLPSAIHQTFIPHLNYSSVFVAMSILGAVIMPHNIFLHSNVILSRDWGSDNDERKKLIKFERIDTILSMSMGWIINSAMIIVAAAVFYKNGIIATSIEQASDTLRPVAGRLAQTLFGIALLFSGIGSSITASFSEANVLTAFLGKPENPRSLFYRFGLIATSIPAFVIIALGGNSYKILILSQVVLSIQLPFTIIPLLYLTRSKKVMGSFAAKKLSLLTGVLVSAIIIGLNIYLLYSLVR